jgi:hypothetical protein
MIFVSRLIVATNDGNVLKSFSIVDNIITLDLLLLILNILNLELTIYFLFLMYKKSSFDISLL